LSAGCDALRLAPGESQKQNAYLHQRTTQAAELAAQQEQASSVLQGLTRAASRQSEAMLAYYGLPRELPEAETVEQLLGEESNQITQQARQEAVERPDPWSVADNLLELGIALAGVVGGVYGTRAVGALQTARQKSQALREIVQGSELFKQQNPTAAESFKQAQSIQSAETRTLVANIKATGPES